MGGVGVGVGKGKGGEGNFERLPRQRRGLLIMEEPAYGLELCTVSLPPVSARCTKGANLGLKSGVGPGFHPICAPYKFGPWGKSGVRSAKRRRPDSLWGGGVYRSEAGDGRRDKPRRRTPPGKNGGAGRAGSCPTHCPTACPQLLVRRGKASFFVSKN